jgi:hypothetical protein
MTRDKPFKVDEEYIEKFIADVESRCGEARSGLKALCAELLKIPAVLHEEIYWGSVESKDTWWISFRIDITHKDAFLTIQHLGHELNWFNASIFGAQGGFYPESPPPDSQDTGPEECLIWKIDCWGGGVAPEKIAYHISLAVWILAGEADEN